MLLFDVQNGRQTVGDSADFQRLDELDSATRPHAIAIVRRRQKAATGRMAVAAELRFEHRLLEKTPLPQRR